MIRLDSLRRIKVSMTEQITMSCQNLYSQIHPRRLPVEEPSESLVQSFRAPQIVPISEIHSAEVVDDGILGKSHNLLGLNE